MGANSEYSNSLYKAGRISNWAGGYQPKRVKVQPRDEEVNPFRNGQPYEPKVGNIDSAKAF
jgi:hypothetical protein